MHTPYTQQYNFLFPPTCFDGHLPFLPLSGSKGKAIPLQAWTGPEASRRLRLPDFKTIGT